MQQQKQSVFLIEHLQPDWLDRRALRWRYALTDRLGNGVAIGLLFMLITLIVDAITSTLARQFHIPLPSWWSANSSWQNVLFSFFIGVLFGGVFGQVRAPSLQRNATIISTIGSAMFGLALVIGEIILLGWLTNTSQSSMKASDLLKAPGILATDIVYLLAGAFAGGFAGGAHIRPRWITTVETIRWSWSSAWRSMRRALRGGLIFGVLFVILIWIWNLAFNFQKTGLNIGLLLRGLVVNLSLGVLIGVLLAIPIGLISGLIGGLVSGEQETKVIPNQGFYRSAQRAVLIGLCATLLLTLILMPLLHQLDRGAWLLAVNEALMPGLLYGLITGLTFGGYACLSHLALRFVLWRQGAMPWNYASFLDYAASRVFLRKVGGGYIFVHRLLLEHFAALPDAQSAAINVVQGTPERTMTE
jgi:hypothetical protein